MERAGADRPKSSPSDIAIACLLFRWSRGRLFPVRPRGVLRKNLRTIGVESEDLLKEWVRRLQRMKGTTWIRAEIGADNEFYVRWQANPYAEALWEREFEHLMPYMSAETFLLNKLLARFQSPRTFALLQEITAIFAAVEITGSEYYAISRSRLSVRHSDQSINELISALKAIHMIAEDSHDQSAPTCVVLPGSVILAVRMYRPS